jgi:hypothetical protein
VLTLCTTLTRINSQVTEVLCIIPETPDIAQLNSSANNQRGSSRSSSSSSSTARLNERSIVGIAITYTSAIGHLLLARLVNGCVEMCNLTAITTQAEVDAKVKYYYTILQHMLHHACNQRAANCLIACAVFHDEQ